MRKILIPVLLSLMSCQLFAQHFAGYSNSTTVYPTYQPAKITLYNGKTIFQKEANVFLKNGKLLFRKGKLDMEANMKQIESVEFADRFYVRMDTMLATVTDTVGKNRILCTTTIDLDAYQSRMVNERVISNFEIGNTQVSASTVDPSSENEAFPLVNTYYFEIKGKIIKLHERTLLRKLPKEKRNRLNFYIQMPDFSWTDRNYLRKILQLFEE